MCDPVAAPVEQADRPYTGPPRLLDVRPSRDFRVEHLAGASNIPLAELQRRTGELPPAKETFQRGGGLTLVTRSAAETTAALEVITPAWNVVEVHEATSEFFRTARELGTSASGGTEGGSLLWQPSPHLPRVCSALETLNPPAASSRRALDLGCGKGRDAVWLALRGWSVVGVDNQSCFLSAMQGLAERKTVAARVTGVRLDLIAAAAAATAAATAAAGTASASITSCMASDEAALRALASLLRPPLALVTVSRFMHRTLLDAVVARMPHGCVLAVHHFLDGAVSLKSGRAIKPHDADMRSLSHGELARRYGGALPEVLLDDEEVSCDGRPVCSYVARKPPLLTLSFVGETAVVVRLRVA